MTKIEVKQRGASTIEYVGVFILAAMLCLAIIGLLPGINTKVSAIVKASICNVVPSGSTNSCDESSTEIIPGSPTYSFDLNRARKNISSYTANDLDDINSQLDSTKPLLDYINPSQNNENSASINILAPDIIQGNFEDCYLLAMMISQARTEDGSNALRSMIKKSSATTVWEKFLDFVGVWSPPKESQTGYEVTFSNGETVINRGDYTSTEDRRAEVGAIYKDGSSIFSLIEASIIDHLGYNEVTKREEDYTVEAFRLITGSEGYRIPSQSWNETSYGFSPENENEIRDAVDSGKVVIMSTVNNSFGSRPPAAVPIDVKIGGPDGETKKVQLVNTHSYAVMAADDNGLSLVNPHGFNFDEKFNPTAEAEIYLTWDQLDLYAGYYDIGEIK